MRQDQDDFDRAPSKAVLPSRFISHSRRYYVTSTALAHGIPMTGVSQSHGQRSIEVTDGIYLHLMPTAWDQAHTGSMRHT